MSTTKRQSKAVSCVCVREKNVPGYVGGTPVILVALDNSLCVAHALQFTNEIFLSLCCTPNRTFSDSPFFWCRGTDPNTISGESARFPWVLQGKIRVSDICRNTFRTGLTHGTEAPTLAPDPAGLVPTRDNSLLICPRAPTVNERQFRRSVCGRSSACCRME